MAVEVQERSLETAEELRDYLSRGSRSETPDDEVIYRGHADAGWSLVPTILREGSTALFEGLFGRPIQCEDQAWAELQMLRRFMEGCDKTGVIVPNDSVEFREQNVTDSSFNDYYHTPSRWPNKNLLEVMAMARLHGLPTRLLDWSTHPYVAAYFAASEALHTGWRRGQRVAIIELNRGPRTNAYCGQIRILKVRGAISMNLVAQHGLFTVHPLVGHRGNPLEIQSLEQYLPSIPQVSIRRLILPIEQSVRLYELCTEFKFDAAQIYPGADGASRSVLEAYQYAVRYKRPHS